MASASIEEKLRLLAMDLREKLKTQMEGRIIRMEDDDTSHFLMYRILGVDDREGRLIDIYQNKGRFLYRYAGTFLETACRLCFQEKFPDAGPTAVFNSEARRPKKFQIDCLVGKEALEIKWRDATTDGDHITKEHERLKAVAMAGYTPIRVMFYYPNRARAIRIQQTLETLYAGIGGHYYHDDSAWEFVHRRTEISLKEILERLASESGGA